MSTPYQDREIPDPEPNIGDEPYFAAAAEGRLLIKRCSDCGKPHHYPREVCPFCLSANVVWEDATGAGEVYSYSVLRRGAPLPYCIAYVKLDEGPLVMTNLVDCDLDDIRIGQRVRAVFKPSKSSTAVPMFAPAVTA
jgi:uncharacterized OB-fold protein